MNQIIVKNGKGDLILSAKIARLSKDVDLIKKGIEDNKQVEKDEKDNIFKKFGKSVSNSVKKSRTESLEKALDKDEKEIVRLGEEGLLQGEDFPSAAKEALKSQDKKTAFGLLYLLSDEFEYNDKTATLEDLSLTLYGNKDALSTLKKELDSNFKEASASLISSIKTSPAIVEAMEGYFASLAEERKEKCALCASKAILGEDSKAAPLLALLLAGKNGLPYCNDEEKAKEAFLPIDKDSFYGALALKATLIQEEMKDWDEAKKKENLKAILTAFSSLNLLAEISYIVDKQNDDDAKAKIKGISLFVLLLANLNK